MFKLLVGIPKKLYKVQNILIDIESFEMLDIDQDKSISDAEFLNYMDNCFISLMAALEKDITENHFKVSLK